jgi:hypothetical protein
MHPADTFRGLRSVEQAARETGGGPLTSAREWLPSRRPAACLRHLFCNTEFAFDGDDMQNPDGLKVFLGVTQGGRAPPQLRKGPLTSKVTPRPSGPRWELK